MADAPHRHPNYAVTIFWNGQLTCDARCSAIIAYELCKAMADQFGSADHFETAIAVDNRVDAKVNHRMVRVYDILSLLPGRVLTSRAADTTANVAIQISIVP